MYRHVPGQILTPLRSWVSAPGLHLGGTMVIVDPSTADLWSLWRDPNAGTWHLRELLLGTTDVSLGRTIRFPLGAITGQNNTIGESFDDDGNLRFIGGHGQQIVNLRTGTVQLRHLYTTGAPFNLYKYTAPRAGRPPLAMGWRGNQYVVLGFDENGMERWTFGAVLYTTSLPPYWFLRTTSTGRTFLVGIGEPPGQALVEIDYVNQRLINHPTFPTAFFSTFIEDPDRQLLYLMGQWNMTESGTVVFDLTTNQVLSRSPGFLTLSDPFGYYPRNRLQASPTHPAVGQPYSMRLTMGGDPGNLGLIYFHFARYGGRLLTGLDTVLSLGAFDSRGLLALEIPYDPALFPMGAGDALSFEGFHWNGSQLVRTGNVEVRWW